MKYSLAAPVLLLASTLVVAQTPAPGAGPLTRHYRDGETLTYHMLDPSLPLTTTDYSGWGNPTKDKAVYDYMLSYRPYDNIHQAAYPALLLTESLNDNQVAY